MDHAPHRDRAQLIISGVLIALGLFMFYQIQLIVADGGYSAIGPRFSPTLVAGVLLLIGVMLLRQALTGGWRNMEGSVPAEPFFTPAFLWIAGGLARSRRGLRLRRRRRRGGTSIAHPMSTISFRFANPRTNLFRL